MSVEVHDAVRVIPSHSFTANTMARKRFNENTTTLALTLGLIVPALNNVNRRLEGALKLEKDATGEEILEMFEEGALEALQTYADRMARITVQTGLACTIIHSENPALNQFVYLWDLYPRLHRRYVDRVCQALRMPRFLATLLGAAPTTDDVAFLESSCGPLTSAAESLKRNSIYLCADVVVDVGRIVLDKNVKAPLNAILTQIGCRLSATLSGAFGAGCGRLVGGENGAYWGELVGFAYGVTVFNLLRTYEKRKPEVKDRRIKNRCPTAPQLIF
ncbi:hypothetical protein AGDE_11606 [Angomonas deanei]|uniref:Uncharacterized protein n=1 Tax=Angomonas deanei TaxID=59799 RepID=A0A7G2CLR5_9TRYP|nr:hypothetical protein AGDE_11606 [Angomonas deanei]CAD2220007.1 hypothetical protein, conserved [Angomonas deanei]|eukprot:EPY25970.1 hypothetical protein AGDE_11606 [Angomonas deanei]